ncbi:hypothetical protein EKO04_009484 [Ascochyta lentis]|uniref:Glutathione S-transferase kappa n=1 Tax=Ascochyta lentis TaxID=205686 RepID=A0A8H7MGL1_9PLEO|nr:hypothetical protein EKO04_009484 [Ascochyta lentis]
MAQPKITFYVDIVSPFAYIAFYVLKNSPAFKQCDIKYVPILLGGLMNTCGNTPPIAIKNKDKWINTERKRWATYFNIPISQDAPPGFPINTLPIQRALTSLSISHPQSLASAISLFYENMWVQWGEPTKAENLLAILRTVVGSDEVARKVLERSKTEEVKMALVRNTEQAFGDGAFGLPYFVATNAKGETEGFWGVDHMGQLTDHLGLERPSGRGWKALL